MNDPGPTHERQSDAFRSAVPHVEVVDGHIVCISDATAAEIRADPTPLLGPLDAIGVRLDDATFAEVCAGTSELRVRLGVELAERPIRLRHLETDGDVVRLEVRSLANEFRMESLLRRGPHAHMLMGPDVEMQWAMSSHDLAAVLPGDDPTSWIEMMDADDMRTLGKAIYKVGKDPTLHRTVTHRLHADRTYTIIDEVESVMHDPDLRGVLVRSRLGEMPADEAEIGPQHPGLAVSDHMPIGVIIANHAGKVLHRNAVSATLVGARTGLPLLPADDGPWMLERLDAQQSARYQAVFAAASAGRSAHCTISSPFERNRWLRVSISPAAASTVVLTIEDTTDLAEAERALRASNRLLEALDSHSEDIVVVFDARGRSRYHSTSALGGHDESPVDHVDELARLAHPDDRARVEEVVLDVRARPSASTTFDFRIERPDDPSGRWHAASITNHLDDPDIQGLVLTVRDVHERHLAQLELAYKASHDALTALPDRAAFQSRLDALLSTATRDASPLALMFFDLDNFKNVNDRAGHQVGDLVLQTVAQRLTRNLRDSDVVGRFGGDEFVVAVPHVGNDARAMEFADRLFAAISGPARCGSIDVDISISMGVAITEPDCTTATMLLQRADLAMYEAKAAGRGQVVLYTPTVEQLDDQSISGGLDAAIETHQFTAHYQPVVPLRSRLPSGYEVFARWDHPEHGIVAAGRFLPLAELSGSSRRLGGELLRMVAHDERPWLGGDEFVCVNLSTAQIDRPDAAQEFLALMAERGVDPRSLVIELTEASFGQGPTVQTELRRFREAGVRVFLDDYGVGYSSLSQLHHFPVDGIKIDASIINPTVDESLVRLIVGVATTLDIRTVAEGVESDEQLDAVVRLGVDYAQGYLLGEPARVPTPPRPR